MDFVDDGIHFTDPQLLDCIDGSDEFDFPKYRSGKTRHIAARQLVHRSGTVFVRKHRDGQGWAILACILNSRAASQVNFIETAKGIIRKITDFATSAMPEEAQRVSPEGGLKTSPEGDLVACFDESEKGVSDMSVDDVVEASSGARESANSVSINIEGR